MPFGHTCNSIRCVFVPSRPVLLYGLHQPTSFVLHIPLTDSDDNMTAGTLASKRRRIADGAASIARTADDVADDQGDAACSEETQEGK